MDAPRNIASMVEAAAAVSSDRCRQRHQANASTSVLQAGGGGPILTDDEPGAAYLFNSGLWHSVEPILPPRVVSTRRAVQQEGPAWCCTGF